MLFGCYTDNPVELTIVNLKVDLNPSKTQRIILLSSNGRPSFFSSHNSKDSLFIRGDQRDTTFAFYNDRADKFTLVSPDTNYLQSFKLKLGLKNDIHFKYKE